MIHEVDEALRSLIRREALHGEQVEILFDAPTKDWAARRNAPAVDVYLYDIREDLRWRRYGSVDVRGDDGRVTARQQPPRYFKVSYLITAWTQRPEDEHRLLSAVLACFLRFDALPSELLSGALGAQGTPVRISIALPPPEDRALSDVWSALGGELKPSLDLVTLVAIDARGLSAVGPPVLETPTVRVLGKDGQDDTVKGERDRGAGELHASGSQEPGR